MKTVLFSLYIYHIFNAMVKIQFNIVIKCFVVIYGEYTSNYFIFMVIFIRHLTKTPQSSLKESMSHCSRLLVLCLFPLIFNEFWVKHFFILLLVLLIEFYHLLHQICLSVKNCIIDYSSLNIFTSTLLVLFFACLSYYRVFFFNYRNDKKKLNYRL